ncbi:hypothetical protein B0I27_107180 [Arcticibacter pallidicorallinus]|uniref:Uncharacterized protein n=1 Tax=Arcticibacter pallidicorallinus TaxID=1259464 RepID=A0A2T0U112_9SPHI|nr:hypothetical protein B0I27_107180 [Arcticibacter pallidicorallinus]
MSILFGYQYVFKACGHQNEELIVTVFFQKLVSCFSAPNLLKKNRRLKTVIADPILCTAPMSIVFIISKLKITGSKISL